MSNPTKPLREVESNGVRCRWNPAVKLGLVWSTKDERFVYASSEHYIDHADAFKQVREQPYVVDAVLEAIREYERYSESGSPESLARTIRPLVLDSTPTEELIAALVKRGARREASCMVTRSTPASGKAFGIGALSMVTTGPVLILTDGAK